MESCLQWRRVEKALLETNFPAFVLLLLRCYQPTLLFRSAIVDMTFCIFFMFFFSGVDHKVLFIWLFYLKKTFYTGFNVYGILLSVALSVSEIYKKRWVLDYYGLYQSTRVRFLLVYILKYYSCRRLLSVCIRIPKLKTHILIYFLLIDSYVKIVNRTGIWGWLCVNPKPL